MKRWFIGLLLIASAQGQNRFAELDRELKSAAGELKISDLRAAVIESGRVVWRNATITAAAPEEPVIADRIARLAELGRVSLDAPAPMPPGATIRQVLANVADGTPGEEVLDNRAFFDALRPIAGRVPLPGAIQFAMADHGGLGWHNQEYVGQNVEWSFEPSLLVLRIPARKLTLVVSANSNALTEAARLEDGNIARSTVALAMLGKSERDELIDRALIALYQGRNNASAALAHQALAKFPELETVPDVTLLYLFAQLRFPETEASATAVIRAHPSLPTAWFYYGQYLENSKRYREAAACYEKIATHQPPWHNWTAAAARKELKSLRTEQR